MSTRSRFRIAALAVAAAAFAGCAADTVAGPSTPTVSAVRPAPHPGALVSLEWQAQARDLIAANRLSALAAGRVLAALSVAQHHAVQWSEDASPIGVLEPGPYVGAGVDPDVGPAPAADFAAAAYDAGGRARREAQRGAVAGASARVLGFFFPAAVDALEQRVRANGEEGAGRTHPHFTRGVATGQAAGDAAVERAKGDGFTKPWTGTVPVGAGMWIPSALPPGGGTFGEVTPYFLSSNAQFRPAPPPAFGSPAFAADVAELRAMTESITPEQLAFARYWDFPGGTPTPIGYWNGVAAAYVASHGLDERRATEVLALTHAAVFDALIACWEAKYHYWTLRPTQADPAISLAFTLPNFPSYPSGHSCASASAGRVLAHFFPDRAAELAGWVGDAGLSRMLAGIHYRFDVTAGQELGRAVADLAIAHGAP